jgi:uncharacterized membrane protein
VNLKSEAQIMALHVKMDDLTEDRWQELLMMQENQIELLREIIAGLTANMATA